MKKLLIPAVLISSLLVESCAPVAVVGVTAAGVLIAHNRRSVGAFIDDQAIELKIRKFIMQNKEMWDTSHISVVSFNGVVLLVGQSPRKVFKQELIEYTKSLPSVRYVYDEITISSPISYRQRMQDSAITAQVAAKISASEVIGPNRIKTVTEDGVVYLMGLANTEEREAAVDIARKGQGVRQVVDLMEKSVG